MAERRDRRSPLTLSDPRTALRRLPIHHLSWARLGLGALALAGATAGATLLGVIWPKPDRSAHLREEITPEKLAPKPNQAVTVLVIGTDADTAGASSNGAAPPGPANGDTVLLVRVNPKGRCRCFSSPRN